MRDLNEPKCPSFEAELLEQIIGLEAMETPFAFVLPDPLEGSEPRRVELAGGRRQVHSPRRRRLRGLAPAGAAEPVEFIDLMRGQSLDVGVPHGEPMEGHRVPESSRDE